MVISTNPKPTIYRNLYKNTGPVWYYTAHTMVCQLGFESENP